MACSRRGRGIVLRCCSHLWCKKKAGRHVTRLKAGRVLSPQSTVNCSWMSAGIESGGQLQSMQRGRDRGNSCVAYIKMSILGVKLHLILSDVKFFGQKLDWELVNHKCDTLFRAKTPIWGWGFPATWESLARGSHSSLPRLPTSSAPTSDLMAVFRSCPSFMLPLV